jgi:hypothetical protein
MVSLLSGQSEQTTKVSPLWADAASKEYANGRWRISEAKLDSGMRKTSDAVVMNFASMSPPEI